MKQEFRETVPNLFGGSQHSFELPSGLAREAPSREI